jgi:hypothetical protein
VNAIAAGSWPTGIAGPAVLVAVWIGVTVSESWFSTYAVVPPGATAITLGSSPTAMGLPTDPAEVLIGVTVPAPLAPTLAT